jgi:hypothetical protein
MSKVHDTTNAFQAVIARATTDRAFRERLLSNPQATMREVPGVYVPPSLRIRFIEKDEDLDVLIVLPDLVPEDGELSDEELEQIAGGTNWCQDTQ